MAARPAYNKRPSTNEPWRYRCPDCGSVSVRRLTGKERIAGKRYVVGGKGRHDAERDAELRFRCLRCEDRKATLYDMKKGREVMHK